MLEKVRNLKLSSLVSFLSILAIIVAIFIGVNGYIGTRKVNNNMNIMYHDMLVPITDVAAINSGFLNMRGEINRSFVNYNTELGKEIEENDVMIKESIKKYEADKLDEKEIRLLEDFKTQYTEYISVWERVEAYTSKGEKIRTEDLKSFDEAGIKITDTLESLVNYHTQVADEINLKSDITYLNTRKNFLTIITISLVLFTAIAYYIIRNIRLESKDMIDQMKLIAEGNFTIDIKTNKTNEFGVMKNTLGQTIDNISDLLKSIMENALVIDNRSEDLSAISEEMASSSESVATAIQEMAKGTGEQAEDLVNITETINHFGEQLESMTIAIRGVDDNSKQVDIMAAENGQTMKEIVKSLGKLKDDFRKFADLILGLGNSISQINDITNLINSISDQTNLLALNAAIEAARAGESGKGFSVVADEIRKLAEQAKDSSENINKLISEISGDTNIIVENTNDMNLELEEQINNVNNSISAFGKMILAIENITPQIQSINSSAAIIEEDKNIILKKVESTSSVAEEVSAATEEIAASSEEVNASSEEVAATAQILSNMVNEMTEKIKVFELK